MGGGPAPQTGPGPATAESIAGLERGPAAEMLPEAVAAAGNDWSMEDEYGRTLLHFLCMNTSVTAEVLQFQGMGWEG